MSLPVARAQKVYTARAVPKGRLKIFKIDAITTATGPQLLLSRNR